MAQKSRIRVCHVASGDLWAGAEVQIAGLLEELRDLPDLQVSAVLLNKGRLYDELIARDIPVVIYDERRLNSGQILKAFYSHFRKERPDIVHTHRYKENVLAAIAAKLSSVPVTVRTVHGLQENLTGWQQVRLTTYSRINAMIAKWTRQCIIGVSDEIASVMTQQFPKNPVTRVHNGIDLKGVQPIISAEAKRRELGIPENVIVIGTVSRHVPVKGIDYLLRATGALCNDLEKAHVRLLVVGDGPLRSKLEALAEELDIDQQTLFLGHRVDVYDLMNLFDIYALPSLHEGIPMALLEAMALGRPVVASRVGGIPEVVTDREAKLVPAQDVDALSKALKELAVSPTLRQQLGQAGRERVARSYGRKVMAAKVRELYRYLMKEVTGISTEISFMEKKSTKEMV
jgi:glycosyltransferase involved in cell wall biosynthesis